MGGRGVLMRLAEREREQVCAGASGYCKMYTFVYTQSRWSEKWHTKNSNRIHAQ